MPLKQTFIRMVSKYPAYVAMPPGAARVYAAVKYHQEHSSEETLAALVGRLDRIPSKNTWTALLAARAVFRVGGDELVADALDAIEERDPRIAAVHHLRADLNTFRGEYRLAHEAAGRALESDPDDPAALARLVESSYQILDQAEADDVAIDAVGRAPRSKSVLWAVAKSCSTVAQFERFQAAWEEQRTSPHQLHGAVSQLATAAARAGEPVAGIAVLRQAIELAVADPAQLPGSSAQSLAGKLAWGAILDLRRAFEDLGVPYFFAAGTALGFVRSGGPLSADSDIDIGVLDADFDRERLLEYFTADRMFEIDVHPHSRKIGLRHRAGAPIDIFPFYADGDRVYHDGVFVRWCNTPFSVEDIDVRGVRLPVPSPSEQYLTENYGDWRTPNSAFDAFTDDAPNVEVTWKDYLRLHYMRRAYGSLAKGDKVAAARNLDSADERHLL